MAKEKPKPKRIAAPPDEILQPTRPKKPEKAKEPEPETQPAETPVIKDGFQDLAFFGPSSLAKIRGHQAIQQAQAVLTAIKEELIVQALRSPDDAMATIDMNGFDIAEDVMLEVVHRINMAGWATNFLDGDNILQIKLPPLPVLPSAHHTTLPLRSAPL